MIGISGALTSTRQLSTPSPLKALIRCSIVATAAGPMLTVVAMRVSFTLRGAAGMSTAGERSVRRKTMPVPGGAGLRTRRTLRPLCRPMPTAATESRSVR